jgi:hypothetical protein
MSWYKTGTTSQTNGNPTVYGTGTAWVDAGLLNIGDVYVGPDLKLYEIASIQSNTQLTLASNYLSATVAGAAYSILPIGLLPSALALQVKTTLNTASTAISSAVLSTAAQGLTTQQQANARANILALGAADVGFGRLSLSVAGGATVTLTTAQATNQFLEFTGTLTSNISVVVPTTARLYSVSNLTTGAYTLTVKTAAGTGVEVAQGEHAFVKCDTTNVVNPSSSVEAGTFRLWNAAKTFKGKLLSAVTAARTWTFPDKDGTVALTSDFAAPGPIGGTTAAAGSFTTLSAYGAAILPDVSQVTSFGRYSSGYTYSVLRVDPTSDGLEIRDKNYAQRALITTSGLAVTGVLSATGAITAAAGFFTGAGAAGGSGMVVTDTENKALANGSVIGTFSSTGLAVTGAVSATSSGTNKFDLKSGINSEASLQVSTAGGVYAEVYLARPSVDASLGFRVQGSEKMRLDASGNLGLGVTPPAWGSGFKSFSFGATGSIVSNLNFGHSIYATNAYWDSGGVPIYKFTGPASYYAQLGNTGEHAWYTAPSGTAGTPITFTQAMTLDASGNLLVGLNSGAFSQVSKASPNNYAFGVTNSSATSPYGLQIFNSATTNSAGQFLVCCDSSANRFLVLGNGNVQNVNNSYGAISDLKLKNIVGPSKSYWDRYRRVQWLYYTLKADPTNTKLLGVVAQELEQIFPGLVEETSDYEDVEVEPARTEVRTVQRQKVEHRVDVRYETVQVDGQWRKLPISTAVEVPVFEDHPLFDETGAALMEVAEPEQAEVADEEGVVTTAFKAAVCRQSTHQVPVMEDVQETVDVPAKVERQLTGTVTKSVKYSVLGTIADVVTQEAQTRIEALEDQVKTLLTRLEALEA